MPDRVSPEVRSRMMAGIRGKNTRPELAIRKGLHGLGYRYSLHSGKVPGKPDLVLPKYRAVIFVHGCFWHGHACHLYRTPQSNSGFWLDKIGRNRKRDTAVIAQLLQEGWRVLTVWECALKGKARLKDGEVLRRCDRWLQGKRRFLEIAGRPHASVQPGLGGLPVEDRHSIAQL